MLGFLEIHRCPADHTRQLWGLCGTVLAMWAGLFAAGSWFGNQAIRTELDKANAVNETLRVAVESSGHFAKIANLKQQY